ncbi:MAG TPA: TlpA disulfide reductase family protein [Anaerolineaceae bacterium]|nr:TlpA disulfide reductase family protein [Anaerolineaceae bacterium]HPN53174.1 TlpA disulfide reductase family protein [Anaerolineaceae bacterium]
MTEKKRPFWVYLVVLLVIGGFVAVLTAALLSKQEPLLRAGSPAPAITLTSFDGQVFTPADLQGKVVVLNFWASWCQPCADEAAMLEAAWQQTRADGVIFLGVAYVDTDAEAVKYLQTHGVTYPNGPDMKMALSKAYRITGVPETFFINPQGVITYHKVGPFADMEEILSLIQAAQ